MIARQVLCIESWIYKSATEFPPCSYRIFIPHWLAVSSLTNNRMFENQLHAAGAQLALVILNKQHRAIIRVIIRQSYPWPEVAFYWALLVMSDLIFHFRFPINFCYLQTWPSHLVKSLADLGGPWGYAPPPQMPRPWLPYCYVCLDSQCIQCLGPIWPPPTIQSRSASACHCPHALNGLQCIWRHTAI